MNKKTTITIDRDLLIKISRIARSRGLTLTNYMTNLLQKALEISTDSFCPLDLLTFLRLYKALTPLEPVPIPLELLLKMIDEIDVNKFREDARKIGHIVGGYLREYMSLREVLDSLYVLREINVVKKIGVLEEKDRYKIIIIGSIGSEKGAVLLKEFLDGFLEAYGVSGHEIYFENNMVKIVLEKSYLEAMMKISLEEEENILR